MPPPPPRVAGFDLGSGARAGEVAVTRFPGQVGGAVANVNRWRRQVGLPASGGLEEEDRDQREIAGEAGWLYRFFGPGSDGAGPAIVVATLERQGESWFFKMTGPAGLLADEFEAFVTFLDSLSFE